MKNLWTSLAGAAILALLVGAAWTPTYLSAAAANSISGGEFENGCCRNTGIGTCDLFSTCTETYDYGTCDFRDNDHDHICLEYTSETCTGMNPVCVSRKRVLKNCDM